MSDSSEAKRSAQERMLAQAIDPGPGGLWSLSDVQTRLNGGLELPIGARMPVATPLELLHAGISVGGAPGNEGMWAGDYLTSTGMSLEEFGRTYKSLPFDFHGDGTMSYNPSAVQNRFDYTPGSYSRNAMIGIGGVLALATAGLAAGAMGGGAAGAGGAAGGTASGATGAIGGMDALLGGAAADFSLVPAGANVGIGGVGTAGQGLAMTGGNAIANTAAGLAAQAGVTLPAAVGGAATGAGLGLNLGASGGLIGETASSLATQAGVGALDALPPNLTGPASGINGTTVATETAKTAGTEAAKTVGEKTLGDKVTEALIKGGIQAGIGVLASGAAKGAGTSDADLLSAQKAILDAYGKLPTEDEAAAQAHADVTQAFNTQRNNYRRQLMSYGLNPDSARYQSTMGRFQGAEAKTDALGQNLARRGVRTAALGQAATLANLNVGLTNAQSVLDSQNFARKNELIKQISQGLQPVVDSVVPAIGRKVSNWFDTAKSGVSNWSSGFDDNLISA